MANKIILTGNSCNEIELKKSQSGTSFGSMNLAVKRDYKDQNGEYKTDFFRLTFFGKQAEYVEKYISKGNKLYIEGHVQIGEYTNKDGQKVPTFDVMVDKVENLTSKEKSNSDAKKDDYIDTSKLANTLDITDADLPF